MIPDEAVEAALDAFANAPFLIEHRAQMILALEAAAPHLLAQAWEGGWLERAEYDGADKIPYPFPNPYKDEDEL